MKNLINFAYPASIDKTLDLALVLKSSELFVFPDVF